MEKESLKQKKIRISQLPDYAADEIETLLGVDKSRAGVISALIEFQKIPSVGPKFAEDLISMGYFRLDDLLEKDGHELFNQLEEQQGFWTDPCVEDQCLLVTNYAKHRGSAKQWWDFTAERKEFRSKHGYPESRPAKPWYNN
ncbi:MAG TPA: helix-hairpin-helix domain-containing protein [Mucilaginibacter sp.]